MQEDARMQGLVVQLLLLVSASARACALPRQHAIFGTMELDLQLIVTFLLVVLLLTPLTTPRL